MVDVLLADLDTETTEAKVEETNRQEDYERMMIESVARKTEDSQALGNKMSATADAETMLSEQSHVKKDNQGIMGNIDSLHQECDWLMKFFDVRKIARTGEIDVSVKA